MFSAGRLSSDWLRTESSSDLQSSFLGESGFDNSFHLCSTSLNVYRITIIILMPAVRSKNWLTLNMLVKTFSRQYFDFFPPEADFDSSC